MSKIEHFATTIPSINYISLDDNSVLAQQPPRILTLLKPHQRACLNKAINMEINGIVKYKISEKNPLNINYRNAEIIIPNNKLTRKSKLY